MGVSPGKAEGFYRRTKDVSSIMKLQCFRTIFSSGICAGIRAVPKAMGILIYFLLIFCHTTVDSLRRV